jgi:hypothetical protein
MTLVWIKFGLRMAQAAQIKGGLVLELNFLDKKLAIQRILVRQATLLNYLLACEIKILNCFCKYTLFHT